MRKLFSLIAAVLFAGSMMASEAKVTLDFTDAGWNFPSAYTKTAESYTNGGFTVAFSESNNGHKYLTVSQSDLTPTGIIFGKQDASISFPAFDFAVGKILVHYVSAQGGANTVHNIFVGDEAVSAAETGCKVTETKSFSTFEIAANAQAAGTIYVLKVTSAHNMQVSKVEFFEAGDEPAEEEGPWAEIAFKAAVAKDALPADSIFKSNLEGFQAKITDTGNKMEIDANLARFGTAEEYVKYDFRLKTGAAASDKNFITVSVPAAGCLGIAPRTGSNSATDRKLFVIQGTDTLFNDIIQESQAIEVVEGKDTVKVYPFVLIPVKAGDVVLRYSAALYFYAFGFVEALTTPEDAPEAPEQEEKDVMALYCNHYSTNNANFNLSGWPGPYQTLEIKGTKVGLMADMTWECLVDPAKIDSAHDYSAYENVHVDFWAPLPAAVKFTAEAFGVNYKDGVKLALKQGWNSFDIPLAEWPGEYDFKTLKCLVFEQYQTPTGQSFEHNPLAFANIYFWKTPSVDTLSCAEAAAAAAQGVTDEVIIKGYVTEIVEKWSSYKNVSFWMSDAQGGENTFEAFRVKCETEADAPGVGDLVWVKGNLTYYTKDSVTYTPETKTGGSFGIIEKAEPQVERFVTMGTFNFPTENRPAGDQIEAAGTFAEETMDMFKFEATGWFLFNEFINAAADETFKFRGKENKDLVLCEYIPANGGGEGKWVQAIFKFGDYWKEDSWKGTPCMLIEDLDLSDAAKYAWKEGAPEPSELPITCADVYDLKSGDKVELNEVVVTYANGANVWIKDETASLLIYLPKDYTNNFKAGDVLAGVAGVVDIYNGIHEVKPSADQAAAIVATAGEAPAAEEVTTVELADVNKYIVLKGVVAEGEFVEGTASNITIAGVTVRNQFKNAYKFEAGKKYDVYGVVSIFSNKPQVYFITAELSKDQALDNTGVEITVEKFFRNGQLIIRKNGVEYNAQGAVVR